MAELPASGPGAVRFLLQDAQEQTHTRFGGAVGFSLAFHVVVIAFAMYLATRPFVQTTITIVPETSNKEIVWLNIPGPGGGGGGGGNRSPDPPRKAELPGKEKITVRSSSSRPSSRLSRTSRRRRCRA